MKAKRIFLTVAAMLVLLLAFTSCDNITEGFFPDTHEHTWEEATCTSPKICSACGETEGEALGHTEQTVEGKDATCTEAGFTDGKICTVCNAVTVPQTEIPAKGHTPGEATTCETNQECTVCHAELEAAKGHTVGPDATCDADQTCTVCNKVLVSALGHVPGAEADCENAQTCLVCKIELAPAKGHTPGAEADCENAQTCTVCSKELAAALGHTPGAEADCENAQTCTVCSKELAPAKGHSYTSTYVWSDDKTTCTVTAACANDATHNIVETATVSSITLNLTAEKATYTYYVKFAGMSLGDASYTLDVELNAEDGIYTVSAPAVANRVASHDYIKLLAPKGEETKTFTFYYSEVDVWDGQSVSEKLEGEGTAENPYLIQSGADLAYFASVINAVEGAAGVNYKVHTFKGQYFKMTKSIDLNGANFMIGMHAGWNNYQCFAGILDGNNCTVRGLAVNNTASSSALFGCVQKGGAINNLSVYGTANGKLNVAGVVAYLLGSMDNVTSYVTVGQTGTGTGTGTYGGVVANQENTAGAINNCVNYGNVIGESYIAGGIAGSGGATLTNCVNWGKVESLKSDVVGGIAGTTKDQGNISDCVNHGDVSGNMQVGGIAGKLVKPVLSCVNYGTVTGSSKLIGGIAGEATKANNSTVVPVITGCVNNGEVIGAKCNVSGIDAINSSNFEKNACENNGTVTLIHALTHVAAKAPECEIAGNVEHDNCSVCGKNFDAEGKVLESVVVPALEHSYNAVVTDPTCEADGFTTYTCGLCGDSYTADIVNGGHKDENTDLKCDRCGANLCVDHVPADAVKEKEVKATCETAGSYETVVNCSICGFEMSRTPVEIPALGHKMDNGTVDGTVKTYACENGCGKTEVKYLVTVNYLFLDGSVAADADVIEYENDTIYTLDAKTVAGYVPSHDYVKGHILSAGKVINIYYSELSAAWDGTSASTSLSGSGTAEDPYLIQSAEDLAYVANTTITDNTNGTNSFTGKYFKLTKSIDLNNHALHIGTGNGWGKGFAGFFDGNNCSIRNMNNQYPLFGGTYTSKISNLSTYGKVESTRNYISAVVSYAFNTTFHNITNYAEIKGVNGVGGVVSILEQNGRTSDNLVNYGKVTATGWLIGGIVGKHGGNLKDSTNWGTCIFNGDGNSGGIAGGSQDKASWAGTLTNCNNYGTLYKTKAQIVGNLSNQIKLVNCGEYGVITTTLPTEE